MAQAGDRERLGDALGQPDDDGLEVAEHNMSIRLGGSSNAWGGPRSRNLSGSSSPS